MFAFVNSMIDSVQKTEEFRNKMKICYEILSLKPIKKFPNTDPYLIVWIVKVSGALYRDTPEHFENDFNIAEELVKCGLISEGEYLTTANDIRDYKNLLESLISFKLDYKHIEYNKERTNINIQSQLNKPGTLTDFLESILSTLQD